ncbi:MAG: MGMT family protein [Clostridia bacterium]|nr:MGMT family protein [Clostridia bacterium]
MSFRDRVLEAVRAVPLGKVSTYGLIAAAAGSPRAARAVGQILHHNPQPGIIPCHRIVARSGRLSGSFAFGGLDAQKDLLEAEGIRVEDGCVDLEKYLDPACSGCL